MKNQKNRVYPVTPESKVKGAYLRGLRAEYGVSMDDLAAASGYSNVIICYWENGKRNISAENEKIYLQALPIARRMKQQKVVDGLMAA